METVVVVSASYDPVMQVLASYAHQIASEAGPMTATHLHDKTSQDVAACLGNSNASAVFFFLHGQNADPYICDGTGAPVIGNSSMSLLRSKTVCGTCFSLNQLGPVAVSHGAVVIGYDGPMYTPLDPRYAGSMMDAALAPHRSLLAGSDVKSAADAARSAYMKTALHWFGRGSITGHVYAALAESNADAIGAMP